MGVDEEGENVLHVRIRKEVFGEQHHARGELACGRKGNASFYITGRLEKESEEEKESEHAHPTPDCPFFQPDVSLFQRWITCR